MARVGGQPEDIYQAVVDRLISRVPDLCNPATTYFSLNPDALPPSPGNLIFVVSPMSANAATEYYEGGGLEQLALKGGLIVKIHSPLQLDEMHKDMQLVSHETLGLFRIARRVIRYIADSAWSPMKGADEITRDPCYFLGFDIHKGPKKKRSLGAIELHFALNFDWDVNETDGDGETG
jgi:hypothetical protein